MALLNSKSPLAFASRIEQLSCRFARTSGRWPAGPFPRSKPPPVPSQPANTGATVPSVCQKLWLRLFAGAFRSERLFLLLPRGEGRDEGVFDGCGCYPRLEYIVS